MPPNFQMARDYLYIPATSCVERSESSQSPDTFAAIYELFEGNDDHDSAINKSLDTGNRLFEMIPPKILRRKHDDTGME